MNPANFMGSNMTRRRLLQGTGGLAELTMINPLKPFAWGQSGAAVRPGAADWPRFGYDLHNTRFNAKETTIGARNVERLKVKWKFDTDENWVIQQTPAVVGNSVFFRIGPPRILPRRRHGPGELEV